MLLIRIDYWLTFLLVALDYLHELVDSFFATNFSKSLNYKYAQIFLKFTALNNNKNIKELMLKLSNNGYFALKQLILDYTFT